MTLANCGAMATYFARCSADAAENLAEVRLVPHTFGLAGGGATQFTVPAGIEMTFARAFRRPEGYAVGVLTGTTSHRDRALQSPGLQIRPLIFADIRIDKPLFMSTFGSNHILAVQGNLKKELRHFAKLLGLEYIDYDRETSP
jgi:L-fucose isomerase